VIRHINAHKGETAWHFGRKRRRRMKRTNLEIIVEEKESKKENHKETRKQTKGDKNKK